MGFISTHKFGLLRLDSFGIENPLQELINKRRGKYKMSNENENNEYKKVEESIFKFEKVNEEIIGILQSVEEGANYNNKVYRIKTVKDEVLVVFGTKVLDSKMASVQIGDDIKIVYTGVKEATKKGFNDTKLFDVYVK